MTRILVAVIYLVSLVTSLSAQVVGAASTRPAPKSGQTTASSKKANATQESDTDFLGNINTHLQAAVKKAEDQQDDTYWVNKGAAMVSKECAVKRMDDCVVGKLIEADNAAKGNRLKAVVCSEKDVNECVPAVAYGQGAVHYFVKNLLYVNKTANVERETSDNFTWLVTNYGLHSEEDRQAAMKYFFTIRQMAFRDCDKVSANEDSSHWNTRRTNYCAEEVRSMAALAMIAKTDQEKQWVADVVYSLMKSKYDAVGGGIIMTSGTIALGVLGTPYAYNRLEQFLTDNTLPSTAGNVWEGINSPIKSSTQNSYKASRKDGRYLNRINEQFLYLDKKEAKRQGFARTDWEGPAIQYPYANTLEDVGVLLGQQSAENGAAKRLATKIVQRANQYAKNGEQMAADIHYPVVVGILDGWRSAGKEFIYVPSVELLTLLYKGDWFDINEGTQRRVHYKAYQFAKARGWGWAAPVKDKQKVQDYMTYAKAEASASVADVVAQLVLLDALIAKLPALAKGISNAVRVLKQRSTWVGTKNFISKLPRTSSVTKAKAGTQAVVKQPVKPAATPKATAPAQTKAAQQPAQARPAGQQAVQTPSTPTPKQPAAQPVAAQTAPAAENAGATTRATGPKQPAVEPKTEAVSPTRLQEQVTGPLAQKVAKAKKPYVAPETSQMGVSLQSDLMASGGESHMGFWDSLKAKFTGKKAVQPDKPGIEIVNRPGSQAPRTTRRPNSTVNNSKPGLEIVDRPAPQTPRAAQRPANTGSGTIGETPVGTVTDVRGANNQAQTVQRAREKVESARKNMDVAYQQRATCRENLRALRMRRQQTPGRLTRARDQVTQAEQNVNSASRKVQSTNKAKNAAFQTWVSKGNETKSARVKLNERLDKKEEIENLLKAARQEEQRLNEAERESRHLLSYWKDRQKALPGEIDNLELALMRAKNTASDATKAVAQSERQFGKWSVQYNRAVQAEKEASNGVVKAQQNLQKAKDSANQINQEIRQVETELAQHAKALEKTYAAVAENEAQLSGIKMLEADVSTAAYEEEKAYKALKKAEEEVQMSLREETEAKEALTQARNAVQQEERSVQTLAEQVEKGEKDLQLAEDAVRNAENEFQQAKGTYEMTVRQQSVETISPTPASTTTRSKTTTGGSTSQHKKIII